MQVEGDHIARDVPAMNPGKLAWQSAASASLRAGPRRRL